MPGKINWTTGPVCSSLGYNSTFIVVNNGSAQRQTVWVRFYDLSFSPKRLLRNEVLHLAPGETGEVDTQSPEVYRSPCHVCCFTGKETPNHLPIHNTKGYTSVMYILKYTSQFKLWVA